MLLLAPPLLLAPLLLALSVVNAEGEQGTEQVEVICPPETSEVGGDTTYCSCIIKTAGLSRLLQVKCDFKNEKAVLLTSRFYAMGSTMFSSAYVRISNAQGVTVTVDFMSEWQKALSSALDIWHCGAVKLAASPAVQKKTNYKTFVGVGIIDCQLENLPSRLLRDHHRGALRVKDSTVGVIQPGFIHNIDELRYLVFEDSSINLIAGPITTQEALTLSHRELHTWNGLLIHNVTIDTIGPNAFKLTHKSDVEEVVLRDSSVGVIGSGGLTVTGDISLNITDNTFEDLHPNAFEVESVYTVVFSGNTLVTLAEGAFAALQCPARRDLANNSLVTAPSDTAPVIVFHSSCGAPKVRLVPSKRAEALPSSGSSGGGQGATAVALTLLAIVAAGGAAVAGVWWWRGRPVWQHGGDTPLCEDQDQPDTAAVNACQMNKPEPVIILAR